MDHDAATMRIRIISTGGTIAKTYDEADGAMHMGRPIIETIIAELRLPDLTITYDNLLSKDSLDLTDMDRTMIIQAVQQAVRQADAVVILHGTDTLEVTGEALHRSLADPAVAVVLTGAMRPYEFRNTDAAQNVTEALLACRHRPPGVYVAMHNRVLRFPGVVKDRQGLSFIKKAK